LNTRTDPIPLSFGQVHADATLFPEGNSKSTAYEHLLTSLSSLVTDQRNWVCNLSNAASLLWHLYHRPNQPPSSPSNHVNWAGFYVLDPLAAKNGKQQLILGPFQGKVACQTIAWGRGVCGTAAQRAETVLLEDVEAFPGHIACDSESQSEVVVPIVLGDGRVMGVIDIDCARKGGFDQEDREGLESLARLLADACDWQ
jgi:putative methionine-R-sulfoxide reductase with GAF domain